MAQLQEAYDAYAAAIDASEIRAQQQRRTGWLGGGLDRERRAAGREYSEKVMKILNIDKDDGEQA
jgi:hypothetical protein